MANRYFKRQGSEVVERISDSRTASPNLWWSPEQMTIHGFTEVTNPNVVAEEDQKKKDSDEKEALIQAKIREQAITALKAEGKIDQSGNIKKKKPQ